MSVLLAVLAVAGLVYWAWLATSVLRIARTLPSLADVDPARATRLPRVTLVVPACNEAAGLDAAVRSKLACDYPDLEVVLVDDRSTDGTGELADRLAADDPRVRALHVHELPDGWLGKVHALARGVEHATGEWLLFSDADVHFAPDALRRAIACAELGRYDLLTVVPTFLRASPVVDVAVAAMLRVIMVGLRPWAVEEPRSDAAVGIGAFILVRREALARTEGLAWLKLEIADDVALGLLLKRSGARCGVRASGGTISLVLYPTLGALVRGVEKQGYSILGRYSAARALLLPLAGVAVELSFLCAFVPGAPAWLVSVGVLAAALALAGPIACARLAALPWWSGALWPLGMAIMLFAMLRSGVLGWRTGGVRWRGTVYPAERLREGVRVKFP